MTESQNKWPRKGFRWVGIGLLVPLFFFIGMPREKSIDPKNVYIVVNHGMYATVAAAANSQHMVDWYDDDPTPDTICTEAHAALELRHYLCKIGDLDEDDPTLFPFVDDETLPPGKRLVVGSLENNRLVRKFKYKLEEGHQKPGNGAIGGFQIKPFTHRGEDIVLLTGNERTGTLYAVYEFLERLGVRWFGPGESNEYLPKVLPESFPTLDIVEWPRFKTRGFWAWESRGNKAFFTWMTRNRLNYWTSAESDIPELKKRGFILSCGGHQITGRFLNPEAPYPYDHQHFHGDEGKPEDPYEGGLDFKGDMNGDKTLTYGEAHPEWYGLHKGNRITSFTKNVNFCTSNKDAVAEVIKNLIDDLDHGEWRFADNLNFWMLDGGIWCECDPCKALGEKTDRNLLLVHTVRQAINRAMEEGRMTRDITITFLAYYDVVNPPTRTLPSKFDYEKCIATFFPIIRCYEHSFDDLSCTEFNTGYFKRYWGWAMDGKRFYRGQLFIGEYYNISGFKHLPVLFTHIMPHDIRFFYKTGARHMHYMHVPTANWGPRTLTNIIFAKLLWNPSVDAKALEREYYHRRYGGLEDDMMGFYQSLEKALSNISALKYHLARNLGMGRDNLFKLKHLSFKDFTQTVHQMRRCREILDQALYRAQQFHTDPEVMSHLLEEAKLFTYAENTILFYHWLIKTRRFIKKGNRPKAKLALTKALYYADLLYQDTESTKWGSSHVNARNGLEASFAKKELWRLKSVLQEG